MNFTHLHVHSHYSLLDGLSKVDEIVDKCIASGMNAVALTDHGNMYGIKDLLDYCKDVNKKRKADAEEKGEPFVPFTPIAGCEVYCARRGRHSMKDDKAVNGEGRTYVIDRSGWHLILLAKNLEGYHNLCRLVSAGYMSDAFYHTPRIDKELLEKWHKGIICCSACLGGELPQKILDNLSQTLPSREGLSVAELIEQGVFKEAEETVQWFKNLFGEDYYIELQRHETQKPGGDQEVYQRQMQVNPVLIELARKYGVKVICSNDSHFINEEDAEAHDRLICLSTNHYVNDVNRMHYAKQEWLKTPEEMYEIFQDIPEALENTREIVGKVEIYDIDHKPYMPKFDIPASFGNESDYPDRLAFESAYLRHLTMEGAKVRYGEKRLAEDEELKERIEFELNTIINMGFPGYFLIVMDFIRAAREELDVSVGPGRGSAAGSVVAYCLKITDLDPMQYDLLFERFLNPDRISLPDIDTDFEDCGRGKVLDYVSRKYGETHVAHIVTYGKMATKSALADVGRVQQVPLPKVNELKGLIPDREFPDSVLKKLPAGTTKKPKVNLRNCYQYVDELEHEYKFGDPNIRSMLDYAARLEGTIRQVGVHACGVIIGADDLTNFAPLSSVEDKATKKRVLVTEYDGHVVESVGLIKMDFLGLITLTIIKECLRNIKKAQGIDVDIDHIPIDDAETYKLFQEGRTVAVFQFESGGMQKYLRELKPTVIGDLIAMNALYRPGPMDYIPQFIRRKQGIEPVTYDIPVMEKYLKDTYGVTVYQEQVMLLSRLLANFTRGESDKLRKAMGKKQMSVLASLKDKFMEGGKSNGHDPKILDKIWKDWEKFASYAFNKSHAACYSWVAYQTGYLKAHYPAEFMAANLTVHKDDIKEVTKLMDECRALGLSVLEPDVNESELSFIVNQDGAIRFGLGGIKGVGEGAAEAIIREREKNGKYKDIFDFLERVNLQSCNRKTIENLAQAGAFECFEDIYREQFFGTDEYGSTGLDLLMNYGTKYQADQASNANSLFDDFDIEVEVHHPALPQVPRWNTIERLNKEKELIGIYLSAHPLDEYEYEVRELCNLTANELSLFEGWRKPEERDAAEKRIRAEIAEMTPAAPAQEEDALDFGAPDAAEEDAPVAVETKKTETPPQEEEERPTLPSEFIAAHKNQTCLIGGIITEAEQRISQKGNPYGRYTIEDYTGSYTLALFGNAYSQFAHMMLKDLYVLITGIIQQKGNGQRWFKEQPDEKAEYEFIVQKVEMLNEAQDKRTDGLNITLALNRLTPELADELAEQISSNKGQGRLHVSIYNPSTRQSVALTSRSHSIHVTPPLYRWLARRRGEGILDFKVVEKN
ncbi:MAG: DNA polymerase III subunit alpha [Paludibacteraceae bacterium]|nr:DNA polymerase III subunit alpha [Paludibacteraceae bacterium]